MDYCTIDDYRARFPGRELDDMLGRDNNGNPNLAFWNIALARATADIHAWIGGRYTTPLVEVTDVVRGLALDLVRYYLHRDADKDHPVAVAHRMAIDTLKAAGKGNATLGLTQRDAPAESGNLVQISPGRNDFSARGKW